MILAVSLSRIGGKEPATRVVCSEQSMVPGFQQAEVSARIVCCCPSWILCGTGVEGVGLRGIAVLQAGNPIAVAQLGRSQRRTLNARNRAAVRLHGLISLIVVLLIPIDIRKGKQHASRWLRLFFTRFLSPKG